jgi:hypothetical protein
MPEARVEKGSGAGVSDVDIPALIAELEAEIGLSGPRRTAAPGSSSARIQARSTAERLARVTADRPLGGREGVVGVLYKPVKLGVRKLTRWYVEPVFADQRAFNETLLRLIGDLHERIDRLEAELDALRRS